MADDVRIRRLTPDDWQLSRDVRLAALADAPYAYGSTLEREQAFDEATWRGRLAPSNGVITLATIGERPVGIIGIYTPADEDGAMLVAAWVRPDARGRGVGDALVADMIDWARAQDYPELELRVADGNDVARNLFLRNGFLPTGVREPLESDPSVGTEQLVIKLT